MTKLLGTLIDLYTWSIDLVSADAGIRYLLDWRVVVVEINLLRLFSVCGRFSGVFIVELFIRTACLRTVFVVDLIVLVEMVQVEMYRRSSYALWE